MPAHTAISQNERIQAAHHDSQATWLSRWDSLASVVGTTSIARWANRVLLLGLILFVSTVLHSVAAAHISLGLSFIAWIIRDLAARRWHFARTPMDLPWLCFAALTIASAIFSIEPSESLPKLRSLLLFGIIYLIATNLHPRGVRFLLLLFIASGLTGASYSLLEKTWGRGMIVTALEPTSPLASSLLQPGDVIWMVARHRVRSLDDAAQIIRRHHAGEKLEIEALHAGDPLPVELLVTDALKAQPNPLGLSIDGPSRRFRVSGFTRHFVTYAEQMQLLALLAYGFLLAGLKWKLASRHRLWITLCLLLFTIFSLTLVLTASRSAIVSCLCALLTISIIIGGRRILLTTLAAAILLGGLAIYTLNSSRTLSALSLTDDSAARRISYMQAGLRLIPQHPLLGVGMDSHKRHWTEWGFPGDYVTHTHSTPIQIAIDRGLPAFGCYVWLMTAMFILVWRTYRATKESQDAFKVSLCLGTLGILTGFSISSLVNYNFGDTEALMPLLLVISLVLVLRRHS